MPKAQVDYMGQHSSHSRLVNLVGELGSAPGGAPTAELHSAASSAHPQCSVHKGCLGLCHGLVRCG